MKRLGAWLLLFCTCVSLCACGVGGGDAHVLGETVSTEIFEFTLERAELAIAADGTVSKEKILMPKEYDADVDRENPYVAPTGSVLVTFSCTVKNLDRGSLGFCYNDTSGDPIVTFRYKGKEYKATQTSYAKPDGADIFDIFYKLNNEIMSPGEELALRGCLTVSVDADLNDPFELVVRIPAPGKIDESDCTSDKQEMFIYQINQAG